jgi:glucose/arabinose dehydrogenase
LAVALGVGMAVANSPAVAWATPNSDSSSSGTSSTGESGTGAGTGTEKSPAKSDASSAGLDGTAVVQTSPSEGTKDKATGLPDVTGKTGGATGGKTPTKGLPPTAAPLPQGKNSGKGTSGSATTIATGALPAPKDAAKPLKNHGPAALQHAPATSAAATQGATLKTATTTSLTVTPQSAASATPLSATPQTATPSAVKQTASLAAAAASPAPASPLDFLASVVTGVVSMFFNPVASGNPQDPAPPSAPTIFGFLDALRREFERAFGGGSQAQTPKLTYNPAQTTQVGNVITGKVVASGLDGTTPAFTATTPAHGTVLITPDSQDPNTATFTYKPTNGYAGPDSFNITVTQADAPPPNIVSGLLGLFSFGLLGGPPSAAQAINVSVVSTPPGFDKTVLASGLNQPTDLRFLPDGRILISEKLGAIKVYDDGQVQTQPLITIPVRSDWSRGLLGIEVDPDFEQNGYVYAAYVTPDNYDRLSRFTVTDPTADVLSVDPDSELVLMQGDQQDADDHHGGTVRIGPDGKLYWSMGDNGWNHTNPGVISTNSQNLSNMYGKILRINTDGSVPDDNPFVDTEGALPQIYAYGFRNPYRMAFAPDGTLLVGDVGEATWEEVDNVVAGGNYGWTLAEGPCSGIGTTSCSTPSPYINPIYAYQHNGQSSAITSVMASGDKVYIADMQHGWIRELTFDSDYSSLVSAETFDAAAGTTSSLIVGPDGNFYQLTIAGDSPNNTGTLVRLTPTD